MYKIKTYNKISKIGLEAFDDKYTVGDEVENADGAIVRSAALHDEEFPASLKAIARAGAGTNNIPIDRCSEQGIVVFNTPGANANAVKELVIAGLLISSRRVVSGIEWVGYSPLPSMTASISISFTFIMHHLFPFKVAKDSDY